MTTTVLSEYLDIFGLSEFRPGQEEVISAVMAGQDCLSIMPTGGGKSLCFQLPSVAREGVTLVVSPLIALMKDQVDALRRIGVKATFVNSSLSAGEQRSRLESMGCGEFDLVYIAPERLRNPRFLDAVRAAKVQLLAVDEAHCVSEWGHDFRPDYARLGRFRQRLGFPQTIALTATATPEVRDDISEMLLLKEPQVFISGFARANLRFEVQSTSGGYDKREALLEFLRENPGSGIVYASTRKGCGEVKEAIDRALKRNVGVYHAGLEPEPRRQMQEDFMAGRIPIIVATNAFGMGINKSNLRFVVHYNMPGSLEAYYQEAGRAGRDGKPSRCLLLFSYQDRFIQEFFIENAYPSREIIRDVYNHLRSIDEDPIEITLNELKERLDLSIGAEGVGACERVLEKCGAIERLDSQENRASVRIDSDLPTLVDLLPKEAKVQRKVLRRLEDEVGDLRYERVYFHPQRVAAAADIDRDAVMRALRELNKLAAFDYVPAFRGRAIHLLDRSKPFGKLDIDFEELDRRRAAELGKLDRVIRFARTRRCRQLEILEYFGDPNRKTCRTCDNCDPSGSTDSGDSGGANDADPSDDPAVVEAVKMVLSGVARMHGRFGKNVVAQMLWGSRSEKIAKFRLSKLSTFGLLKHLRQNDIVRIIDALILLGLIDQVEVERHRPTIELSPLGVRVMRAQTELPDGLNLPRTLLNDIRRNATSGEQSKAKSDHVKPDHSKPDHAEPSEIDEKIPEVDLALLERLRDWRRTTSQDLGCPLYRVMTNDTLSRLAGCAPKSIDDLLDIKGIGPTTAKTHGDQLLRIITAHTCSRENIEGATDDQREIAEPPSSDSGEGGAPRRHAGPTTGQSPDEHIRPEYYWTWKIFNDGYSFDECLQVRRVNASDAVDHILQAAEAGMAVRLEWLLSDTDIAALAAAVGDRAPQRIRSVTDKLPRHLDRRHVQLYVHCRL